MAPKSVKRSAAPLLRAVLFAAALAVAVASVAAATWRSSKLSTLADGCDLKGNDVASLLARTTSDCETLCVYAIECQHWTFITPARWCYLKRVRPSLFFSRPHLQGVCGVLL